MGKERFIHDELARRAEEGLGALYRTWKKRRSIAPFIIAWPSDTVYTQNGHAIEGPCVLELPPDKSKWRALLIEVIHALDPYGIIQVEQRTDDVQAIFETRHGTKCWTMPIVRSGDVDILKEPIVAEDQESLGLLWRPN